MKTFLFFLFLFSLNFASLNLKLSNRNFSLAFYLLSSFNIHFGSCEIQQKAFYDMFILIFSKFIKLLPQTLQNTKRYQVESLICSTFCQDLNVWHKLATLPKRVNKQHWSRDPFILQHRTAQNESISLLRHINCRESINFSAR